MKSSNFNKLPTCFYRGIRGIDNSKSLINPFHKIRRSLPTFSDSPDIAQSYSLKSNDGGASEENGVVGIYKLKMDKPITLPLRIGYKELKLLLGDELIKGKDFENSVMSVHWYEDGAEVVGTIDNLEENKSEEIYTSSWELCDQPEFIELLKRKGYDSVMYEGDFLSQHLFMRSIEDAEMNSSYDSNEETAMEYRVFSEEQVDIFFSNKEEEIDHKLNILINQFLEKTRVNTNNQFIIPNKLHQFLNEHGIKCSILMTQGKLQSKLEKERNNLVNTAICIDETVIEFKKGNRFKAVSKDNYLRKWKWLISEKELPVESYVNSEMSI